MAFVTRSGGEYMTLGASCSDLNCPGATALVYVDRPASICTPSGPYVHARPVAANPISRDAIRPPNPMT